MDYRIIGFSCNDLMVVQSRKLLLPRINHFTCFGEDIRDKNEPNTFTRIWETLEGQVIAFYDDKPRVLDAAHQDFSLVGANPQILRSASPLYNISDEVVYPKFLILASGNRESSMTQGKKLADALKKAGGKAQFIVVKNHSHRDMNLAIYDASDPVGSTILKFILYQKD